MGGAYHYFVGLSGKYQHHDLNNCETIPCYSGSLAVPEQVLMSAHATAREAYLWCH